MDNYPYYFEADIHMMHKAVYNTRAFLFEDEKDMTEKLIDNILNTVPKYSSLFLLGDFYRAAYFPIFWKRKLHVLFGNHDNNDRNETNYNIIKNAINNYFSKIICYFEPFKIGNRVWVSHEPIINLEKNCLNIHGHYHNGGTGEYSGEFSKGDWDSGNRYFNVAADKITYTPIKIEEICYKMGININYLELYKTF